MVVVGEFNSGKSSLLNAILGARCLNEGLTPTTKNITIIKFGTELQATNEDSQEKITIPNPILKDLIFVDTPGTNAIFRVCSSYYVMMF